MGKRGGRIDFFRDKDTYVRRTWIRRKQPRKSPPEKCSTDGPAEKKGKTPRVETDDRDEENDVEMTAAAVLVAVKPLPFQRQGQNP